MSRVALMGPTGLETDEGRVLISMTLRWWWAKWCSNRRCETRWFAEGMALRPRSAIALALVDRGS